MVSYITSGATLAAAALAAGISARTLRGWLARGEGRDASRPSTPKLRRFAKGVRKAQGEVRVVAENRMFTENPKHWLSRLAPGSADDEGWRDPPVRGGDRPGSLVGLGDLSDEELTSALHRLLELVGERLSHALAGESLRRSRDAT